MTDTAIPTEEKQIAASNLMTEFIEELTYNIGLARDCHSKNSPKWAAWNSLDDMKEMVADPAFTPAQKVELAALVDEAIWAIDNIFTLKALKKPIREIYEATKI